MKRERKFRILGRGGGAQTAQWDTRLLNPAGLARSESIGNHGDARCRCEGPEGGSQRNVISEFQMALRWSQPAVRPEERRKRLYGDAGNGGGTDPGGGDAAEEDIGPSVVLRDLRQY